MNESVQQLIDTRGVYKQVEGNIIQAVCSQDNQYIAFATADGDLWVVARQDLKNTDKWIKIQPHEGGILCLVPDVTPNGFLTAGDDNHIMRTIPDEQPVSVLKTTRWVEHMVTYYDVDKSQKMVALTVGKEVHLYKNDFSNPFSIFEHPSTVSDLVFSKDGSKLATAYYNTASLWSCDKPNAKVIKDYVWKGSHIVVALHPHEEALVTSMQDNDLHGWRISDGHNMRMSGYPTKVKSLCFSNDGKWLATSGTESVVMWPFFDGGPMGKPPVELPGIPGSCCSIVQFHPSYGDLIAAGFRDGSILLISPDGEKILPICLGQDRDYGSVTALSFNNVGDLLCFGTENGIIAVLDLGNQS